MKTVDVVIINYQTKDLTVEAVKSVYDDPVVAKIIVVDNGSKDDSADFLKDKYSNDEKVVVECSADNIGFGPANNRAARLSDADYIFFINSDAVAHPGCVAALQSRLASEADIGIIAPAIYLPGGAELQSDAQGSFPGLATIIMQTTKKVVTDIEPDWVSEVAFMVRREEFLSLGGFDEAFFMYFEDIELCYRYRQAKKRILRCLDAAVTHLGGKSKASTKRQKDYYYKSQDLYFFKVGAPYIGRQLVKLIRAPYRIIKGW